MWLKRPTATMSTKTCSGGLCWESIAAMAEKVVFSVSSDGLVYMANQLRQGAQFPPLILVTKNVDAYLVVMEGHVRLTAYLIVPEYIPSELEVILGTSPQITNWGCY